MVLVNMHDTLMPDVYGERMGIMQHVHMTIRGPWGYGYGLTATGMHFFFEVTGMQFCLVSTVG